MDKLLQKLEGLNPDVERTTADLIAELRISAEGQEGMAAILEKRKPKWLG